ncbi:hypothetical protein PInf_019701 [Phytophthora infestans]|nr:hypothetical protein PInf_019701 [Phytophthora infestans]
MVAVRGKYVSSQNIPFGVAWKELKKQGWTSVRPRVKDLDPRWKYVRPGGHVNGTKGIDFFLGEEELFEYYSGASKKPSSTSSGPFQTPPAPPADYAVTTRSPPAQAATTQPTSPLQPSSGTQQPLTRQTQVKRTQKVPKPPATDKQKRRRSFDDAISDEEKAPVPVAEPVAQVVAQTPIVLPGPHGGDEENVESGDEGYSSVESVEENNETVFVTLPPYTNSRTTHGAPIIFEFMPNDGLDVLRAKISSSLATYTDITWEADAPI